MLAVALVSAGFLSDGSVLAGRAAALARPESLSGLHAEIASEPHVAGTPGERRQAERIAALFRSFGLETELHEFHPYLARPVSASLAIVGDLALALRETPLAGDPDTGHPDLVDGWNAFSGSGEVEAEVVYANYATRADFARLRELGVSCEGKIVLARYGGNYRGFKAKFAEEAGAVGLVLFTDPADAGFRRGPVWPEGGWANADHIQRGSLLTLPQPGDALTPGVEATTDAPRLDPASLPLPRIPVQPIGHGAAEPILVRMAGREVVDESWRGGLPVAYRLEGGPELRLRLRVEQERFLGASANVIARLPGAVRPEEEVIVGCHYDAWGFGASDPHAGTIALLELARVLAEAARAGHPPRRTVTFAAWGAEEFGIIGSVEWVEGRRERLERDAVAYLNLDMAAMGPNLWISAAPSLAPATYAALAALEHPARDGSLADAAPRPPGDLGGGSDHVGFWCHAGVPSLALGASGSAGTSYHSNFDTLAWYRATVGDDYAPALLVTHAAAAIVAALADAPEWPDCPEATIAAWRRLVLARQADAATAGLELDLAPLLAALDGAEAALPAWAGRDAARRDADRRAIRGLFRDDAGLPGRPWFRNRLAATDRSSGYGASMLPALAEAIEDRDLARARAEALVQAELAERLAAILAAP